ncbi:MAG: ATP-binding protein [Gallionellaceae bacterium]|nr:ATP-binding protein [Gallionellaceae bacterium]
MEIEYVTEEERKALLKNHPIITKNYFIITPTITSAYALIRDRVFMRKTGTFLYATPRMGKTTCAKVIKLLLEAEFPDTFIIHFSAENNKQKSGMLIDILCSEKIAFSNKNFKDLQMKLLTHIHSSLSERNGNQFILIIDEMQNLSEEDLIGLAAIHNRLEPLGIRMTTIGFGQPEIMDRRSSLMATNQSFLIARFLCEPIPFNGCASKEDLEKILSEYDEKKFYPENSDYSFTRIFLPQAYDHGFRLSKYANKIWSNLMKAAKGLYSNSIPMEHLSRTIEFILVAESQNDCKDFTIKPANIKAAVDASNLQYFSGLMGSASN